MSSYFVSFDPRMPMEENLPTFSSMEDPRVVGLVKDAAGVFLPTYVTPSRYDSIVRHSRSWFPRFQAKFRYCGKIRQVRLFRKLGVPHPPSLLFRNPEHLRSFFPKRGSPWGYPFVLKGDTGGGGSRVFPVRHPQELEVRLAGLPPDEPVLIQQWVDHGGKDLRVVVYGDAAVSYFRIGGGTFYNNLCRGGREDHASCPELQEMGRFAALDLCARAEIDLAGLDLMFPPRSRPVFVEINFHFGRKGLGGTPGHRRHLSEAVRRWRERILRGL